MSQYSKDEYRALLVRDPAFSLNNVDLVETSTTQKGSEPDKPAPLVTSYMYHEAKGETSASESTADKGLNLKTAKSGPAIGGTYGGRYIWQTDTTGETGNDYWRGWWPHNSITGHEWIRFVPTPGEGESDKGMRHPDAVYLDNGRVLVAYHDRTNHTLRVAYQDDPQGGWTDVQVYTRTNAPTANFGTNWIGVQCMVQYPTTTGNRIILLETRLDNRAGGIDYYTIGAWISDDDGVTWVLKNNYLRGLRFKADTAISTGVVNLGIAPFRNMRAVYHNGYISLFLEYLDGGNGEEMTAHYVSVDLGGSLELVEQWNTSGVGTYPRPYNIWPYVSDNGSVFVVYRSTTLSNRIRFASKGSPFSKLRDSDNWQTFVKDQTETLRHTAVRGNDGALYVLSLGSADPGYHHLRKYEADDPRFFFEDTDYRGETLPNGQTPEDYPLYTYNAGRYLLNRPTTNGTDDFCLSPHRGRILLLGGVRSPSEGHDESLGSTAFGGYSSIDWSGYTWGWIRNVSYSLSGVMTVHSASPNNSFCYLPIESLQYYPGVLGSNTTQAINNQGCRLDSLSTPAGSEYYVQRTIVGSETQVAYFGGLKIATDSGSVVPMTATIDPVIGMSLRVNWTPPAGIRHAIVTIALKKTIAQIVEITAGGGVANQANTTIDAGSFKYDFLLVTNSNDSAGTAHASGFFRKTGQTKWSKIGRLTLTGAAGSASLIGRAGHIRPATNNARITEFQQISFSTNPNRAPVKVAELDAAYWPGELRGRPFVTYEQWLHNAYRLKTLGGPAYIGDQWQLRPRYEYGYHKIFPEISASPRVGFRSRDSNAANQTLAWTPSGGKKHNFGSSSIGILCAGINWNQAVFAGYNGVSWVTIATINPSLSGLNCTVSGAMITPSGVSSGRFFLTDELKGSYVIDNAGKIGKINRNTAGEWASSATRKACVLECTLPSGFASGALTIRRSSVVTVVHGVTTDFEKYRLVINSQDTYEDNHMLGVFIVGPLFVFGRQYSRGRVVRTTPKQEIFEARDGSRQVEEQAPLRRSVELTWSDYWDTTLISGSSVDPDFMTAGTGFSDPIAIRDNAYILEGALRRARGAREPVVYLPRLDKTSSSGDSPVQITAQELFVYGRIVSGLTRTANFGDEDKDELVTYNALVIDEEI